MPEQRAASSSEPRVGHAAAALGRSGDTERGSDSPAATELDRAVTDIGVTILALRACDEAGDEGGRVTVRRCGETPTPAFYEERIRHLEAERDKWKANAESYADEWLDQEKLRAERQQAIDALRAARLECERASDVRRNLLRLIGNVVLIIDTALAKLGERP